MHHRGEANHFLYVMPGQITKDLILYTIRKVNVLFVRTDILERKHSNTHFGWRLFAQTEQRSNIAGQMPDYHQADHPCHARKQQRTNPCPDSGPFSSYPLCASASLADIAKGGDGATSAL